MEISASKNIRAQTLGQIADDAKKAYDSFANISYEDMNIARVRQLENNISEISECLTAITAIKRDLAAKLRAMDEKYKTSVKKMGTFVNMRMKGNNISRVPSDKATAHTDIAPPREKTNLTEKLSYVDAARKTADEITVNIIDNYSVTAKKLQKWSDVHQIPPGILHYSEEFGQFAIKIAGELFYGNIGKIYTTEKDPLCVKNCGFGQKCTKNNCTYYHDPMSAGSSGKNMIRNYNATSFLYTPAIGATDGGKYRHFGSLDNIPADIMFIDSDECARLKSQIIHDILCSLLLSRYRECQSSD